MKKIEMKCCCGASILLEDNVNEYQLFTQERFTTWLELHSQCLNNRTSVCLLNEQQDVNPKEDTKKG